MFLSGEDLIFKNELKDVIPASVSTSRSKLWPFVDRAEKTFILPILEKPLYDSLTSYYQDRDGWTSGTDEDKAMYDGLIKLVQISLINLAYYLGFDVLNVKLSDAGFQRAEGESFKGLYKYQEENLRTYFRETGFNGIEDILTYLETNIEYFSEWEDSSIYTTRKTSLIKDVATFDAICSISNSRLIFLRLQRYMREVIDFEIKPLLGDEYATLISEIAKASPVPKYSALLVEVQKPIAYLSCARLIENTGNITDKGLFFEGKNSLFPDDTTRRSANSDEIAGLRSLYNVNGYKYIEALRQYLINNSFTEQGSVEGNVFNRDNTDKKTFIA